MMHHRLTQAKSATKQDIQKALDVLVNGSKTLLERSQVQSGAALALLVTKHFVDHKLLVSDETIHTLANLSAAFESSNKALSSEGKRERLRFLKAAVSWSTRQDASGLPHGHPRLNSLAAHAAAQAGDHSLSQSYFISSDDPTGAAETLFAYASEEILPSERPLALTRVILSYLQTQNIADANTMRKRFAKLSNWPSVSEQPTPASVTPPLANFCELLLLICQRDASAAKLFQRICDAYQPHLQRDPAFRQQLVKIGQMYFNIQPPQPAGLAGMMGTMLRGMMNNS